MAADKFFEAQIPITLLLGALDSQLADAKRKVTRGAKKMAKELARIGPQMSVAVTAPIVAVVGLATKVAIDLESGFAGVRKTVEATEQQFSQLRGQLVGMSKEIPTTAIELFKIAETAGQLGVKAKDITTFTKTIALLGETTNLLGQQGATQLARFANITRLPLDQIERLGSAVVALGNNLATTEAEIVNMSLRLASGGKIAGLTDAEILALSGTLSSLGVNAEAAGTSFTKFLRFMTKAAAQGGEELEQFAAVAQTTSEEFVTLFEEDASKAIEVFMSGLSKLDKATKFNILESMGMSDERMSRAILAVAGNTELLARAFALGNKAFRENTALAEEAEKRFVTMAAKISVLKNRVVAAVDVFSKDFLGSMNAMVPPLEKGIDLLSQLAMWFVALPPTVKQSVAVFLALVAVIGPLGLILAVLVPLISSTVVGFIAISAAIAAGIPLLVQYRHELGAMLSSTIAQVSSFADTVASEVKNAGSAMMTMPGFFGESLRLISDMLTIGKANFRNFVNDYIVDLDKLGNKFSGLTSKVKVWWREMKDGMEILTGTEKFGFGSSAATSQNTGPLGGMKDLLEQAEANQRAFANASQLAATELATEALNAKLVSDELKNMHAGMLQLVETLDPMRGLGAALESIQEIAMAFPGEFDERLQSMAVEAVWERFEAAGLSAVGALDPFLEDIDEKFLSMLENTREMSVAAEGLTKWWAELVRLEEQSKANQAEAFSLREQVQPAELLMKSLTRIQELMAEFPDILDDETRELLAGQLFKQFADVGVQELERLIAKFHELDPVMAKVFEDMLSEEKKSIFIEGLEGIQNKIGQLGNAVSQLPGKWQIMARAAQIAFALIGIAIAIAKGDIISLIANVLQLAGAFGFLGDKGEKEASRLEKIFDKLGQTLESIGDRFTDQLVDALKTGRFEFRDFIDFVLSELARVAIQAAIVDPIIDVVGGALLGGLGSKSASIPKINTAGAFSSPLGIGGGMPAFAMAGGGKGGSVINIHDHRRAGAEIEVTESMGPDAVAVIDVVVRDAITRSVAAGHTDNVFAQKYGTRRRGTR